MLRFILSALFTLLLTACQTQEGADKAATSQSSDKLLSTQTDALKQAGAVEQQVLDAAQRQREQIEADGN